jgi:hypothetical protein
MKVLYIKRTLFKRTAPRYFQLQVCFMYQFLLSDPNRVVSNFKKKSLKIFTAQGAPPVSITGSKMEKILNRKGFSYFIWKLWEVELIYGINK